ncbi:MAG: hypothetical protein Q8Q06_03760 [bacterium]|nr:hypothetical protein [bacterium]
MTKKYISIIFLPILLAVLNGYISSYNFFRWGYDNRNDISIFLFALSLAGSVFVLISNIKSSGKKLWLIVSATAVIINALIIYAIYSLSSFGF